MHHAFCSGQCQLSCSGYIDLQYIGQLTKHFDFRDPWVRFRSPQMYVCINNLHVTSDRVTSASSLDPTVRSSWWIMFYRQKSQITKLVLVVHRYYKLSMGSQMLCYKVSWFETSRNYTTKNIKTTSGLGESTKKQIYTSHFFIPISLKKSEVLILYSL